MVYPGGTPVRVRGLQGHEQKRATIGPGATPSAGVKAGAAPTKEGEETTHYSVLDAQGNVFAKFEGIVGGEELRAAVEDVLAA